MTTDTHLCVPIERALEELEKGNNLFEPASPLEVFLELMDAKSEGKKFYSGCNNMTAEGSCAGHEHIEKVS